MMAFEMSLEGQMSFEQKNWGHECPWDTRGLVQEAAKRAAITGCPAPRAWYTHCPRPEARVSRKERRQGSREALWCPAE